MIQLTYADFLQTLPNTENEIVLVTGCCGGFKDLILLKNSNVQNKFVCIDTRNFLFGNYDFETDSFTDIINKPTEIKITNGIAVASDTIDDGQAKIFLNEEEGLYWAFQIGENLIKKNIYSSNYLTYTNEQQAAIYLAKSILIEQGLMEKANLL